MDFTSTLLSLSFLYWDTAVAHTLLILLAGASFGPGSFIPFLPWLGCVLVSFLLLRLFLCKERPLNLVIFLAVVLAAGQMAFLLLTFVVNLLATLLPGLVLDCVSSHEFFVHWLLTIVLGPAIAYGIGIGMVYALTSMSKLKAEFGGVLSVVGVSSTLPMMLLAASMLLSLIDSNGRVLAFFAVVIVLAWLLSLLLAILQTYDIKINLMTILAVIGVFFVAVILCRTLWHWRNDFAQSNHRKAN